MAGPRIMVVDDSVVVRGLVSRWVDEDPQLRTVGRYSNGKLAVDGIVASAPDVVVLDIEMPVMDGMTALPQLLQRMPGVKIIMASTLTRRNAEISLRALSLGAVDYVPKPESNRGVTTSADFRDELIRKIKAVGRASMRRRLRRENHQRAPRPAPPGEGTRAAKTPQEAAPITLSRFSAIPPRVLAIGSSTGGPQALAQLMKAATTTVSIPVLVTQHMPRTFTAILAEHLAREAGRPAKEAEDGEPLQPGTIYVAPGSLHMAVRERHGHVVLHVYDGPDINFCKPAVDPLFDSVAREFGSAALAVVLTGMGQDGAAGARRIVEAGGSVIAQDEATSIVWGMPGAAAATGACAAVLPIQEIAPKIGALLQGAGS